MKLEVHERIALQSLLPKEGTYEALKDIRVARESIAFSPEEIDFYEIKTITGSNGVPVTQWNTTKAQQQIKDVPISEYITNLFRKKLVEMDRKGELKEEFLSAYDKFVVMYS